MGDIAPIHYDIIGSANIYFTCGGAHGGFVVCAISTANIAVLSLGVTLRPSPSR
jgi:hypothetical protein